MPELTPEVVERDWAVLM